MNLFKFLKSYRQHAATKILGVGIHPIFRYAVNYSTHLVFMDLL